MKLRWLLYKSCTNPETGEHFSMPSTYRKLQMQVMVVSGSEADGDLVQYLDWVDVPEVAA